MEESLLLLRVSSSHICTRPSAIASQRSQRETCAPNRTAPRARGAVGEIGAHGHSAATGGPSVDFTPELSISARDNTPPSSVNTAKLRGASRQSRPTGGITIHYVHMWLNR